MPESAHVLHAHHLPLRSQVSATAGGTNEAGMVTAALTILAEATMVEVRQRVTAIGCTRLAE